MDEAKIAAQLSQVTADVEVTKMVLTMVLGTYIQGEPKPEKTAAEMYEVLAARLDLLPITQGDQGRDAHVAMIRDRLGHFFANIRKSLKPK